MENAVDIDTVQRWLDSSPFIRFLGLRALSVDSQRGVVSMEMPMRPELERGAGSGQFHGGPVAAMIDTVGDFAVSVMVKGGVPTINLRVDYLRPSAGARLVGTASVRRLGRTVGVVDIDVVDGEGRLTAIGRGTFSAQKG